MTEQPPEKTLVVFQSKKIRRIWFNDEWWFSVVDIVGALTQTDRARKYWSDLKKRLTEEGFELSAKIGQLKLRAEDGKLRLTDCANTKSMFRIIQSIPSKRAEPFKQWLAQVGYERVEEIQDPALAQKRMKKLYKAKGRLFFRLVALFPSESSEDLRACLYGWGDSFCSAESEVCTIG